MAVYYVGPGGNNANAGTSWALRKLTLNGAEDIPVAAGDTVYVGPGTYRELLTVDVSGTAGNAITYIGDYTGANTSGTKGIVRITGSDSDITATRAGCITATSKNYRTFRGFQCDTVAGNLITLSACTYCTVDKCNLDANGSLNSTICVLINGAGQSNNSVTNCFMRTETNGFGVDITHTSTVDSAAHVVSSCVIYGGASGVRTSRVGGVTVSNCVVGRCSDALYIAVALNAGQTFTVNNCLVFGAGFALRAVANDGTFVEDYNNIQPGCAAARSNVTAGANSVARAICFDPRWFFEMVNGGRLVTPFDLASFSTLVEYNSGAGAPSTDMRGASVVGTYREWGALEHSANYRIQGPVSIAPIGGIG